MDKTKKKRNLLNKKSDQQLLIMCIPAFIKILIFSYLPLVGIYMAFVNYIPKRGIFGSEFIGFKNFEYLFKTPDFVRIFGNAITYNLMFIFTGLIVSVLLALLLFEIKSRATLKVYQTMFFLPYFVSWILVGNILKVLLDSQGMITKIIENSTGMDYNFYTTPGPWRFILVLSNIWKGAGVSAIIYYATLMNCDICQYEAAELDGANRWQKMWYISIPHLTTMMCVNTIMSGANILKSDIGLFFYATMDNTALWDATDVIDTYIWRILRKAGNFQVGTAVGLVQGVFGLGLTLLANWIVRKIDESSALY